MHQRITEAQRLEAALDQLRAQGRHRTLQWAESQPGPEVQIDGRRLVMFSTNDYLGLAAHPVLIEAASVALSRYGVGSTASRLIAGSSVLHQALETRFAEFVGKAQALLFPSGFQANLGVISVLADAQSVVYSDALNHASIIDGVRLSKAERQIYRHADADDLEQRLRRHPAGRRAVIVTESLFSMDGDRAPLAAIADLADAHGATLIVDEAHALGVLGPGGRGLVAELGIVERVDVIVGTFGKAFGSAGAAVACSPLTREILLNCARSFIYTTAPPPAIAAATLAAFPLVEAGDRQRRLHENWQQLQVALQRMGLSVPSEFAPIVPLVIGEDVKTMALSAALREKGLFVQGIRPPTVPEGTARLRLTLMAMHEKAHLTKLADALREVIA